MLRPRHLPWLFLGAAACVGVARAGAGRRARRVTARLRPGAGGVVPGAEPIHLEGSGRGAVLLLHGFGDTPQSLARLALHLHGAGWTVHVPLLPGHGRSLEAFGASGEEEWLAAAREALHELRREHHPVFLLGQSMGGALATALAAEAQDLPGLVLLAPYLGMPASLRWLARSHAVWGLVTPWVTSRDERSIRDPLAREASLGYGALAPRLLGELLAVSERARAAAPAVSAPVLALYSTADHRVSREEAERGFAALGAREKWLVFLEGPGHVLSVDVGHERVFELVEHWLGRRGAVRRPAPRRASRRPPDQAPKDTAGRPPESAGRSGNERPGVADPAIGGAS